MPDTRHFPAGLAAGETVRVKRDIRHQVQAKLHDALGDLYQRLGKAVEHVGERL